MTSQIPEYLWEQEYEAYLAEQNYDPTDNEEN